MNTPLPEQGRPDTAGFSVRASRIYPPPRRYRNHAHLLHIHDKSGGWAGDTWTFRPFRMVVRWRCICGVVWIEER